MAVVFISPKQRQRTFFLGITVVLVLFLAFVAFGVLLSSPKPDSTTLVFNKPKVSLDMKVFESDKFKNLELFSEMQMQYEYSGASKDKEKVDGFISAASIDEARKILENMDLSNITLKEAKIGRENPFTPY